MNFKDIFEKKLTRFGSYSEFASSIALCLTKETPELVLPVVTQHFGIEEGRYSIKNFLVNLTNRIGLWKAGADIGIWTREGFLEDYASEL